MKIQRSGAVLHLMGYFLTAAILVSSCGEHSHAVAKNKIVDSFTSFADSAFHQSTSDDKPAAYMILPNTGCGGCISSAEKVFADCIKNNYPVRFILTNINSLKVLRQNLGDQVVMDKRVYKDTANILYRKIPELVNIYPVVFYLDKNGRPERFQYVNPENPQTLDSLQKFVQVRMAGK